MRERKEGAKRMKPHHGAAAQFAEDLIKKSKGVTGHDFMMK